MSDFVQTMRDWRRMCVAQEDGSHRDVCQTCPLGRLNGGCCGVYEGDMDYVQVESAVTAWAEENPEPVYPTWFEWLKNVGALPADQTLCHRGLEQPIPADIAQKLGIEPKEG